MTPRLRIWPGPVQRSRIVSQIVASGYDVQRVYANFEVSDAPIAKMGA